MENQNKTIDSISELEEILHSLIEWSDKNRQRSLIVLASTENGIARNVIQGKKLNVSKLMYSALCNDDTHLTEIFDRALDMIQKKMNEYEYKELIDRMGGKVNVKS